MNADYQTMNVELEELKRQVEMLSNPERIRQMAETQGMVSGLDEGITVKKDNEGLSTAMRE
jgi:cell division protein FtsL